MKFTFLVVILALIVGAVAYGAINWQKYGSFWAKKHEEIDINKLSGLENLHSGKNICTKGYLISLSGSTVLKNTLSTDVLNDSVWLNNVSGKSFFVDALGENKAALARVCGVYEYGRGKGFGQPAIYNQQITVGDFELLGDTVPLSP